MKFIDALSLANEINLYAVKNSRQRTQGVVQIQEYGKLLVIKCCQKMRLFMSMQSAQTTKQNLRGKQSARCRRKKSLAEIFLSTILIRGV